VLVQPAPGLVRGETLGRGLELAENPGHIERGAFDQQRRNVNVIRAPAQKVKVPG
jgi:hypothetical protein